MRKRTGKMRFIGVALEQGEQNAQKQMAGIDQNVTFVG